jgi:hypothetical protein
MPLVLEVETANKVAPGLLQAAIQVEEAGAPSLVGPGREAECERLEHSQDGSNVPELGRVEGTNPKAATKAAIQNAFSCQAEEGFADRSATDAELRGQGHVSYSAARSEHALLDLREDAVVDLVAERDARNHGSSPGGCGVQYFVYSMSDCITAQPEHGFGTGPTERGPVH